MQREDPEGIVISCDFCRRDWDGQEAMIEGHHGSILCLLSVSIQGEKQRAECAPKGTAQRAFSSLPKNHYRHIL